METWEAIAQRMDKYCDGDRAAHTVSHWLCFESNGLLCRFSFIQNRSYKRWYILCHGTDEQNNVKFRICNVWAYYSCHGLLTRTKLCRIYSLHKSVLSNIISYKVPLALVTQVRTLAIEDILKESPHRPTRDIRV